MKKNNLLKLVLLIATLAMIMAAAFAVGSLAADTDEPYIKVSRYNVSYGETLSMLVAVDAQGVENVKLEVYAEKPADGVEPLYTLMTSTVTPIAVDGNTTKDYLVFCTKGVPAKQIFTEYYLVATSDTLTSDPVQYSIIEYLHEMLYVTPGVTETQKTFFEYVKGYGEYAVRVIDEIEPASYVYAYVDSEDAATLFDDSLVTLGNAITPTADSVSSWTVYDEDGTQVATVASGASFTADAAGSYKFVANEGLALQYQTFEDYVLNTSPDCGTSSSTNLSATVTDSDSDGNQELKLYNSKTAAAHYNVLQSSNLGDTNDQFIFDIKIKIESLGSALHLYNYYGSTSATGGTNYHLVISINTDGSVVLSTLNSNGDANSATATKTLTADGNWHTIRVAGGHASGSPLTVSIDGDACATLTLGNKGTTLNMLGVKVIIANSTVYLDDIGVNKHD